MVDFGCWVVVDDGYWLVVGRWWNVGGWMTHIGWWIIERDYRRMDGGWRGWMVKDGYWMVDGGWSIKDGR